MCPTAILNKHLLKGSFFSRTMSEGSGFSVCNVIFARNSQAARQYKILYVYHDTILLNFGVAFHSYVLIVYFPCFSKTALKKMLRKLYYYQNMIHRLELTKYTLKLTKCVENVFEQCQLLVHVYDNTHITYRYTGGGIYILGQKQSSQPLKKNL